MMKTISIFALSALLLALGWSAAAQQPMKIPSIGFLSSRASPTPTAPDSLLNSFRDGLRELGYIEGKNIAIEYRFAGGKNERLPSLAAELVRLKVDVIVSSALPSSQAAKQATATIPIVLNGVGDPVAWGLVESLARPGGNVTGLVNFSPELSGKRVELLKEAFPRYPAWPCFATRVSRHNRSPKPKTLASSSALNCNRSKSAMKLMSIGLSQ
jgi:putative ABC transport system substrate-binding protein